MRRLTRRKTPSPDLSWLNEQLQSDDLAIRKVTSPDGEATFSLAYLKPLVDPRRLADEVIRRLLDSPPGADLRRLFGAAEILTDRSKIVRKLLGGSVAVCSPDSEAAAVIAVPADKRRRVEQPTTETVLLSPKEAFTEDLDTNLYLVRRRLPTDRLRISLRKVGRLSRTRVAVLTIDGVTDRSLMKRLTDGVSKLRVDYVNSTLDIAELLVEPGLTPFPLSQRSERTARVVDALADGRAAVLVDGSPFALLLPTTLNELQRDGETYLGGALLTASIRWLRHVATLLSVLTPALYAATLSINPELLPPSILLTIAETREGVPYPILLEVLLMLVILDIVTEASLQAPPPIGQTLTIAGSLIIGQAAVQARLASQVMVIVLAVTAVGGLLAVNLPLTYAVRIVRYPVVIAAGILGHYGLTLALVALTVHAASLKSMGVPFLAPAGPVRWADLRFYSLLSGSKATRRIRPQSFHPEDDRRLPAGGRRPRPEGQGES